MTSQPTIIREPGAITQLKTWLSEQGARRILVITGSQQRFVGRILSELEQFHVEVFAGATVHVPRQVVDEATGALRSLEADTIVTLGGGSATGLGKALRLHNQVRFAAIPSTYSGSEMTSIYGITDGSDKETGRDPRVRPDLIIHDPELTGQLPLRLTVTSLINALAHPISALSTGSLTNDTAVTRQHALEAIATLYGALEQLAEAPSHRAARQWAVEGAAAAAMAIEHGTLGLHHKLAHLIGGRFRAEHSALHSVLLPHFVMSLRQSDPALYDEIAEAAGNPDLPAGLSALLARAGAPTSLSQLGVSADELDRALAEHQDLHQDLNAPWLRDALLGRQPSIHTRRVDLGFAHPVSIRGPELTAARRAVIVLHGRGSNADRALIWSNEIVGDQPDIALIAPQGPQITARVPPNGHHAAWYLEAYHASLADHGEHLLAALQTVEHTVAHVLESLDPADVFLLGFSQGACIGAEFVARSTIRLGGLIALAGSRFGSPEKWSPLAPELAGMPMLFGASKGDRWVAASHVEEAAAFFADGGADVEMITSPDNGHQRTAVQRIRARELIVGARKGSTGFGNAHDSEELPGALPRRQNSPRYVAYSLYAEQINGTGFAARRRENLRAWMYRVRPSAQHSKFEHLAHETFRADFGATMPDPNLIGYRPIGDPPEATDFIDGMATFGGAGSPALRRGFAIHLYAANTSMEHRTFYNADGDFLLVPEKGRLTLLTEMGSLDVGPGQVAILPRGIKFSVLLRDDLARGYVAETYGRHFELPERGPVGANGLTDERHFLAPAAWHEDRLHPGYRVTAKFTGQLFDARQDYSPYDVVAWHGNYTPYVYDLMVFSPVMNARFDHPDPSIYTVLSAPLDEQGSNTLDFVFFPPRWDPTEHTFRPPFFHRNATTEFNGIIADPSLAESGPFYEGGYFLTPAMTAHGVLNRAVERTFGPATERDNQPERIPDSSMWFQFETALPISLTPWAQQSQNRIDDWHHVWGHYRTHFSPL